MFNIKKYELVSWFLLSISGITLYFIATDFFVFPSKYKIPFLLLIVLIICITGILSIVSKNGFAKVCGTINCLIIILMITITALLPNIENRIKKIFNNISVETAIINVYVLNRDYKEDFNDYKKSKFITQNKVDQDNQKYAIDKIKETYETNSLLIISTDGIVSAAEVLYDGEGELLVLNEAYVSSLEEIEEFKNFSEETNVVYTINKEIEINNKAENVDVSVINTPFTIYVAGCDTRSGRLSIYGRTDVNLIVTVNPITKQIMICGIPRDAYIPNPAINYGNDKLTHLGNDSIYNTIEGVEDYFDIDIDYYGEVIFDTFKKIINAVGGIDVENPYYFTTYGGNGGKYSEQDYEFPEGTVHLTGDSALAYCRERYNLPNGDYGRNEHQTIALKALIQKLLSPTVITNYNEILDAVEGQFLTDMEFEDITKLIQMQLEDNSDWDIITYHLGGEGKMQGTASMGWDRLLYTVNLFDSQVNFIRNEIEKMENDQRIKQQTLPNEADTTFIPN